MNALKKLKLSDIFVNPMQSLEKLQHVKLLVFWYYL